MFYMFTNNGFVTTDSTYCATTADLQYDANPNPFLKAFPVNYPVYNLIFYGFDGWEQAHNFKSGSTQTVVYYTTGGGNNPPLTGQTEPSSYEYRSDGYPIVRRDFITPVNLVIKNVFIYGR